MKIDDILKSVDYFKETNRIPAEIFLRKRDFETIENELKSKFDDDPFNVKEKPKPNAFCGMKLHIIPDDQSPFLLIYNDHGNPEPFFLIDENEKETI